MVYHYPIYNVSICNFNELFEYIKVQLHAQCIKYNIAKADSDCKKLLIHCTVKAMCDVVLQHTNTKIVFFINHPLQCNDAMFSSKVAGWMPKIQASIQRNLPLKWYCSSHNFEYFQNLINQNKGISFLQQVSNKQTGNYTFNRAHKFAMSNNLSFLDRSYFNDLKMRYKLLNT